MTSENQTSAFATFYPLPQSAQRVCVPVTTSRPPNRRRISPASRSACAHSTRKKLCMKIAQPSLSESLRQFGVIALAVYISAQVSPYTALASSSNANVIASDSDVATLSSSSKPSRTATEAELRAQSRRNTRVTGAASQLFSRARRAGTAGNLDEAEMLYRELIKSAPNFAPGYSNLANTQVSRGEYVSALENYNEAIRLAPLDRDAWIVYINRGVTRIAAGEDARGALEDMNAALELDDGNRVVLANRGSVWEHLGKYENAAWDYQKALDSNDVQPFWLRYGLVLIEKGKFFEALGILRRLENKLDAPDIHAAVAVALFERGELGMAEAEWAKLERPKLYESKKFLKEDRKWPPKAIAAVQRFRGGME